LTRADASPGAALPLLDEATQCAGRRAVIRLSALYE
jgi:hypothetical protein